MNINFNDVDHICDAFKNGDEIVFTCPVCEYERRINIKTGEIRVKGLSSKTHSGTYNNSVYNSILERLN